MSKQLVVSMASNKRNINIKHYPEFFSDEAITASEALLDKLEQQRQDIEIHNLTEVPEALQNQATNLSEEVLLTAEQELEYLFDKYYNGDRNVDISLRHANKEQYKQELIQCLQKYGITYVEKHHYPLSNDEKHIIRMDFYGTINRPHTNKLSNLYQAYISLKHKRTTSTDDPTKKKTSRKKKENKPTPIIPTTNYNISDYDLSTSTSWKLFRLFPRFHKLETKLLNTIQDLNIPPEHLKMLSVYDFSDLLYRTFRKSETATEAHLFLGARQSFVKDVFSKNETWLRNYLTQKNVHPRYIEALIKSAQNKGITGNLNITSDTNSYMSEFAILYSNDFQTFIAESIKADTYALDIRKQIKDNSYNIQGSALSFLQSNRHSFEHFIKKHIIEESYINLIIQQLDHKIPPYVLKDIKSFIATNTDLFSQYLKLNKEYSISEYNILKHLTATPNKQELMLIKEFIHNNQQEFFLYMLDNNRSTEYANFAIFTTTEYPPLSDYTKDIISSFVLHNKENSSSVFSNELIDNVQKYGLTDSNIKEIIPTIKKHQEEFKKHFKNNNILTFNELKNEFIEASLIAIQSLELPIEDNKLQQSFVLSNEALFKNWYIRFHTEKYKENANTQYTDIANNGIGSNNEEICQIFIKERLGNFIEFAEQHHISPTEIIKAIQSGKIKKQREISTLAHDFIVKHGSSFKNFLLQQYLKAKEQKFDISLKKIKTQGISSQNIGTIHRFIIDNQALYAEYLNQSKLLNNQTQQIYSRITRNKSTSSDKEILKSYLNTNIYNYLIFQQSDEQLLPYIQTIVHDVKQLNINPTRLHWIKLYTLANKDKFINFMQTKGMQETQNCEELFNNIKCKNGNISIPFEDGYTLNLKLTVHHKNAVKDSGYQKTIMKNIASINNFSNLCIFTEFWHKVMHNLDCTEPFEDKERFVSRLMPTDKDIIFFGGENHEDKLHYDYENDPRSKRTERHLGELLAANYER